MLGGGNILEMRETKACTLSISQKSFCKTVTKTVIKVKRSKKTGQYTKPKFAKMSALLKQDVMP